MVIFTKWTIHTIQDKPLDLHQMVLSAQQTVILQINDNKKNQDKRFHTMSANHLYMLPSLNGM